MLRLPYHDIGQLFRRVVFNYLAGVTDDHDKNFSFIMSENGVWRLSPAYDITFIVNYKNRFIGDRHAMSIEESNRRIKRGQLLRLAEENDVRYADEIINEIADCLMTFEHKAKDAGVVAPFCELITGFINEQVRNI